ncbi:hypothetical protein [Streptomyces sp. NPDC088739]|uniref:hypothetical protein n=1 Tax=Streptomyces sp. NPDC088739 TaxID=3365882 RepID=UPI00381E3093
MTLIEQRGTRWTVTRLDDCGRPVGDAVPVEGLVSVELHRHEAARMTATAEVLGTIRDRLADVGQAARVAAAAMSRALAPVAEGRLGRARPGVEAQRSPYGPRRRW